MQVLPYNIGIGKFFIDDEKDLFAAVKGLEKNKKVPATGIRNGLKTRNAIRPGMIKDKLRIPIYQGDFDSEGTNPLLNNLVCEVIITGESMPSLLPEGSDVDITIKVDRSEQMQFSAYFPLLNHTEEMQIEIKQTIPPTEEDLNKEITKAKITAKKINALEVTQKLEALEKQLDNEKGSADGKMKILDGLRKELLKLEDAEKTAEWPKTEQELKKVFNAFEDLIRKIKENNDDKDLNMEMVEAHIQEYKNTIDQVIKDKNTKEAKHLIKEIDSLDFNLRNAVSGNALDVQFLKQIDAGFNSFHWKDRTKARQLVNQGLHFASEGKASAVRPILIQLFEMLPDDEKPKDTLV
jgi:molecular chaperone DnaK